MNKIVGVFDAKTQFSKIVRRAEQGEETLITRHGKVVAKVIPANTSFDRQAADRAVRDLLAFSDEMRAKGVRATPAEIKEWINDGRP